jgi:hypothetical protein
MKLAQSFQYRGTPVVIQVNSNNAIIRTYNHTKTYLCTDINLLKRVAETLVDQEIDGNIHNNVY